MGSRPETSHHQRMWNNFFVGHERLETKDWGSSSVGELCLALLRSETSAVLQLSYYLTSLLKTRNCRVALYHFYKILIVEQLVSSRHFTFLFPVHSSPNYYSSKLAWWIIVTVNWVCKTPSNSQPAGGLFTFRPVIQFLCWWTVIRDHHRVKLHDINKKESKISNFKNLNWETNRFQIAKFPISLSI